MTPLSSLRAALLPLLVVTLAGFATTGSTGQQPIRKPLDPALRPMIDSPLAANETAMFAVGRDRKTIIWRQMGGGPWEPMQVGAPLRDICGLSWGEGALFALDRSDKTIYRIRVEDGTATPISRGGLYSNPSDLAYSGHLFVADPGTQSVFEIDPKADKIDRLPEFPGLFGSRLSLAASGADLLIANTDRGEIWYIERVASVDARVQLLKGGDGKHRGSLPKGKASLALRHPGAIAYLRGVVYAVDQDSGRIYAFPREAFRPVPLAFGGALNKPTRLAAVSDRLIVLDNENVRVWPRLIPTELRFDTSQATAGDAMADFYSYLSDLRILPTRTVKTRASLEETLQAEQVPAAVARVQSVVCRLNPSVCGDSKQIPSVLSAGIDFVHPDVYTESYVDRQVITLKGDLTLEEEVRRHVRTADLTAEWNTEEKLRKLNPAASRSFAGPLKAAKEGTFVIPAEFVRYYAALPFSEFERENSALARLRQRHPGIEVQRLDERLAYAATTLPAAVPQLTMAELKALHDRILTAISADKPAGLSVSDPIGIAEKEIDRDHPDFGVDAFVDQEVLSKPLRSQPPPTTFEQRNATENDHGTMVAAILAARKSQFGSTGLLPDGRLLQIHQTPPGEVRDDIRNAYMDGARVFNMSFRYEIDDPLPLALRRAFKDSPDAVFVVAAGNNWVTESDEVCETFMLYPACFGELPNVITVTATDIDGNSLIAPRLDAKLPGVNWNPAVVHVAAPGEGFYVAGKGHSYALTRGSSFAAPLVTATAALLHAQHLTGPMIKQRILATADPLPNLKGRVQAGRLNVRRAITNPSLAVLVEGNNARFVKLESPNSKIIFALPTDDVTVRVGSIRRLTRAGSTSGSTFRIVYVDGKGRLQIEDGVPRSDAWTFRYRKVDAQLRPTGSPKDGDFAQLADYVGPIQ